MLNFNKLITSCFYNEFYSMLTNNIFNQKLNKDINNKDQDLMIKIEEWQKTKDKQLLQEIINRHILLIEKVAKNYKSKNLEMHDLVAEGILGLIHGLEKFRFDKNVKPSTYLYYWVKSKINIYSWKMRNFINVAISNKNSFIFSILKELKEEKISYENAIKTICDRENLKPEEAKYNMNILSHKMVNLNKTLQKNQENNLEWEDLLENNDYNNMIEELELKNIEKLIQDSLMELNEKEKNVINKRFLKEVPMTLKELAEEMKMSNEGIRNIEMRAIDKLKQILVVKLDKTKDFARLYMIFLLGLFEEIID